MSIIISGGNQMIKNKVGREFTPAPQFKTLYYIYFVLIFIFFVLSWAIPVIIFTPLIGKIIAGIIVIFIAVFTLYWIGKYYQTLKYDLTGDEITWKRGVWFQKTGVVSYNRITNIDIDQGPIMRRLGISSLKVQTAGYSAQSGASAELKIEGVKNPEDFKERIQNLMRGKKPEAVETYESEKDTEERMLEELVKIRKLLEKD